MKTFKFFYFILSIALPSILRAEVITYSAISASMSPDTFLSCTIDYAHGGITGVDGSSCRLFFPILIPDGSTLNSITVYYYDDTDDLAVFSSLIKQSLSSSSSSSELSSCVSTFSYICDTVDTSPDVEYFEMTYGKTISNTYSYYLDVEFGYGTQVRAVSIDYD